MSPYMLAIDAPGNLTYEVTSKYALKLYDHIGVPGQLNLVAIPKHRKGTRVNGTFFSVWGENISNAECFNRRLQGKLANNILGKRSG